MAEKLQAHGPNVRQLTMDEYHQKLADLGIMPNGQLIDEARREALQKQEKAREKVLAMIIGDMTNAP